MRDNLGFIDLDELNIKNIEYIDSFKKISFMYNKQKYYYKHCKKVSGIYNELIAEELAKDYKIGCALYDLGTYMDDIGLISEDFIKKGQRSYTIEELLKSYYSNDYEKRNNINDICFALTLKYADFSLAEKLKEQLINIFVFDALVANVDRNSSNLRIIEEKDKVNFSNIFDNEMILTDISIESGAYSLGLNSDDYYILNDDFDPKNNILEKAINSSDSLYKELLIKKMHIIDEVNIKLAFEKVENKIRNKIPLNFKKQMINDFSRNIKVIDSLLEKSNKQLVKKL